MDKYTLLLILNTPFVIFGVVKALTSYNEKNMKGVSLAIRLLFWLGIFVGLVFSKEIYTFVLSRGLSDTEPLSLADVILTTGVIFSLSLCIRIYSKLDLTEKRLEDLHERVSIELSRTKIDR